MLLGVVVAGDDDVGLEVQHDGRGFPAGLLEVGFVGLQVRVHEIGTHLDLPRPECALQRLVDVGGPGETAVVAVHHENPFPGKALPAGGRQGEEAAKDQNHGKKGFV